MSDRVDTKGSNERERWHLNHIQEPGSELKIQWKNERISPDSVFKSMKALEVQDGRFEEVEVDLLIEDFVDIVVDGRLAATVPSLLKDLQDMAVGFLVCEGYVSEISKIVSICIKEGKIICETAGKGSLPTDETVKDGSTEIEDEAIRPDRCRSSDQTVKGCSTDIKDEEAFKPKLQGPRISSKALLTAVDSLNDRAEFWRRTGASHISAVSNVNGDVLLSREDTSRSSSMDKAVGAALISGVRPDECVLITSGRLSASMVQKAMRAGFRIIASRSAPLYYGVEMAKRTGMTLVGFARPPRLYIYSGHDRIDVR